MPQVEEVFVSYPFLRVSSLKAPVLPSKAYMAVDHTGEALHTMAVWHTRSTFLRTWIKVRIDI